MSLSSRLKSLDSLSFVFCFLLSGCVERPLRLMGGRGSVGDGVILPNKYAG